MQSKYYKWNKRGSRIVIDSGYKEFDNYIVSIGVGNVIGGGQFSNYIRSYNTIQCGFKEEYEKGFLRDYDLSLFKDLDEEVKNYVKDITQNNACILYEFYTYKYGDKNIVGYIVEQENGIFKIFNNNKKYWSKKQKCLELIKNILMEEREVIKW